MSDPCVRVCETTHEGGHQASIQCAEFTEPFNQEQRDLYSYFDCIMWSRLENSY
jgi:hypothetical protein